MPRSYQPIIIIGAGRSGTNMLRDCLCALEGFETWPCDEINLIWRHGNRAMPHDEFGPSHANAQACGYIRSAFDRMAKSSGARWLVEKTCANSLRVPFVDAVIPEARYIFIVRDGRDVTASAMQRWRAGIEPRYLAKKLRFVPAGDIAYYGRRFVANRLHQMRSGEGHQKSWGPRFAGIDAITESRSLAEVCATQWARCVAASLASFQEMDAGRWTMTRYEDFLADPQAELKRVVAEVSGADTLAGSVSAAVAGVRAPASGDRDRWRRTVPQEDQGAVERLCKPVLAELGHGRSAAP